MQWLNLRSLVRYFIAKIINDVSWEQPTFHVRDRETDMAIISLCSYDTSQYNLKNFAAGNTVCLMYALRGTLTAIRVEDSRLIHGNQLHVCWIV